MKRNNNELVASQWLRTAKYITVLDSEVVRVFQYKIEEWDIDNESCEEFLTRVGHNLTNCQWMTHEDNNIISHPDTLAGFKAELNIKK